MADVEKVVKSIHGNIIESSDDATIFELTGYEEEVELAISQLERYNVLEIVRSGKVAMASGNYAENQPELNKTEPNWSTRRILESF